MKFYTNWASQYFLNLGITEQHVPLEVFPKWNRIFDPGETTLVKKILAKTWKNLKLYVSGSFFWPMFQLLTFSAFLERQKFFVNFFQKFWGMPPAFSWVGKRIIFEENRAHLSKNPNFFWKNFENVVLKN